MLVIRCSAARRPHEKRYNFQKRIVSEVEMCEVSHAAVVVDEDKTKIKINSRWCQCVRERIGPDRMMDVYGIYIYFVIFSNLCYLFVNLGGQRKERQRYKPNHQSHVQLRLLF